MSLKISQLPPFIGRSMLLAPGATEFTGAPPDLSQVFPDAKPVDWYAFGQNIVPAHLDAGGVRHRVQVLRGEKQLSETTTYGDVVRRSSVSGIYLFSGEQSEHPLVVGAFEYGTTRTRGREEDTLDKSSVWIASVGASGALVVYGEDTGIHEASKEDAQRFTERLRPLLEKRRQIRFTGGAGVTIASVSRQGSVTIGGDEGSASSVSITRSWAPSAEETISAAYAATGLEFFDSPAWAEYLAKARGSKLQHDSALTAPQGAMDEIPDEQDGLTLTFDNSKPATQTGVARLSPAFFGDPVPATEQEVPRMPRMPRFPGMPAMPSMPRLPDIPRIEMPDQPDWPLGLSGKKGE